MDSCETPQVTFKCWEKHDVHDLKNKLLSSSAKPK